MREVGPWLPARWLMLLPRLICDSVFHALQGGTLSLPLTVFSATVCADECDFFF